MFIDVESPVANVVPDIVMEDDAIALDPFPRSMAFAVCVLAPVPPSATGTSVPPAL